MNRFGRMLVLALPLFLCGCLEISQKIIVNKNGGGRIVERFLMSKDVLKMVAGFFDALPAAMGAKPEKPAKPDALDLHDKKKIMAEAERYGPGVKYLSSKRLSTAAKEGYEAVYEFKDITALRINQDPSGKGPTPAGATPDTKEENITFLFEKGNPATLTVVFPEQAGLPKKKKGAPDRRDRATRQQATAEQRELLKDLSIGITVQPEGRIVATDATYRDGDTVTLLEMDFKQLVADDRQYESFAKKEPESVEEAKALLKKLPGFKVELKKKVTISFE